MTAEIASAAFVASAQGAGLLLPAAIPTGIIVVSARRAASVEVGLLCAALALAAFLIIGSIAIPVAMAGVMALLSLRRQGEGGLGRGVWALAKECSILLAGLAAYTALRLIEPDPEPALANAESVISLERTLGLFIEPDLQRWVMQSEPMTRGFNWFYSFGFLAVTSAALLWLWAVDEPNYKLLRNSLGISAVLAVCTFWLFPVAPPRLMADSGMVDTIVLFGREHKFANEYAAIPSLHVGWMSVAGLAIGRSIGGRKGIMIGLLPGMATALTVIVTGNHLWIDGAVGCLYALGAAALFLPRDEHVALRLRRAGARWWSTARQTAELTASALALHAGAIFALATLGPLLAFMIIGEVVAPGFTDFWGYLVAQVAVVLVALLAGEIIFRHEGGLSWLTHAVAVACCYADVLGTAGDLYANVDTYDKLTHFAGIAAVTAGFYDCFRGLYRQGRVSWSTSSRLVLAAGIGTAIGIGWEVYEFLGDRVFETTRFAGAWDTTNDLLSDVAGAVAFASLLWLMEVRSREPTAERDTTSAPAELPIGHENCPERDYARDRVVLDA